jgi:hypothetical protein
LYERREKREKREKRESERRTRERERVCSERLLFERTERPTRSLSRSLVAFHAIEIGQALLHV